MLVCHADIHCHRRINQEDPAIIAETGADVSYTDDPDAIAGLLPDLDILYLSNNQPLADPELQQEIHNFVSGGGPLLLVQAAIWYNWQEEWPDYHRDFSRWGSYTHSPFREFDHYLPDE